MADRSWDHGVTARNETQKLAETPADSDITKSQKKNTKKTIALAKRIAEKPPKHSIQFKRPRCSPSKWQQHV